MIKLTRTNKHREYLKAWMKVKGWTKVQLGKEASLSHSTIANYVHDKQRLSDSTLKLISFTIEQHHPVNITGDKIDVIARAKELEEQKSSPKKSKGNAGCNCYKQVAVLTMEIKELKQLIEELTECVLTSKEAATDTELDEVLAGLDS